MFVTSFSAAGYAEYGKHFLDTWKETNQDHPLVIYGETEDPPAELAEGMNYRNLFDIPGVAEVARILGQHEAYRGLVPAGPNGAVKYSWKHDAFKFFRKVVAIKDAYDFQSKRGRYLAWIDADIEFHKKMPENVFQLVLPMDVPLAYIGRSTMHSECGFMVFDCNSQAISRFMPLYWAIYVTGAFSHLREWHDSYIFDHVRELLVLNGYSLSGPECEDLYPFDNTILASWMKHHKGPERKTARYPQQPAGVEQGVLNAAI